MCEHHIDVPGVARYEQVAASLLNQTVLQVCGNKINTQPKQIPTGDDSYAPHSS